jgi:hypothetical protein
MHARPQGPTVRQVLERMDEGWAAFHGRVSAIPLERLADSLGAGGWSRKQMLAHVVTWHDLTVDRLARFAESGEPQGLDGESDAINARAARAAEGRTTGEILLGLQESFRRLRRAVARLSDGQLYVHDGWAAAVIAGNSYDHYAEHRADLD